MRIIYALLLLTAFHAAHAQTPDLEASEDILLSAVGGSQTTTIREDKADVRILLLRDAIISHAAVLMSAGVLSPGTSLNRPILATGAAGTVYAIAAIRALYQNSSAAKSTFFVYVVLPEEDPPQKHLMFSFHFDRSLWQKTDWNSFGGGDLILNAPGFTYSPWMLQHMTD